MPIEQMAMPQLGESVTEGTISKWLVKPGDHVAKYDPIAEVMTDKVNAEIPSSYSGKITELTAQEGEMLQVGVSICKIEVEEAEKKTTVEEISASEPNEESHSNTSNRAKDQSKRNRYSPAVLRLAEENGINLQLVEGTGAGGRITRKDLQKIIESGTIPETSKGVEKPDPAMVQAEEKAEIAQPLPQSGDKEIPVSGVRKTIAANMVKSKTEIPHAWMMVEVDVTDLVTYRNRIKEEFKQKEGFNLTFFAFFVKAVAKALKEFPQINSTWAGDSIIQKKDIHLSIAVAAEDALYVPVIKHADDKTIKGIARDIVDLAKKARSGTLNAEDMSGGTFTVNNTGSFGSIQSMGIINHPQAAILQIESIVKRPMVMEGNMIAIRDMINICLSIDHRVLDGLVSGRFLARVKEILETIDEETMSVY
ncbi:MULTISPECIES: dihydrolipoamide acetyltransferase family protein [Bacillus]|uniref:Dihydrolipoamide acetyltransferase component of pyruvate dehydrogenase complex n=2 Tax=Bacillus TaxID=1386 RepID=A0A0M4G8K7_9BACI|nr:MULTISPECIES: dihydrolipoamide acetyltransferase family protein [Bacillus]ALC81528.1 branched-chain alpha-keto acid dehydrogenase subunit E2 [Bacillus gobiensis]MBP1080581.1 2-oxoisovalerate dehydrogenase E2 component (dihydrolipoyl transacylase) [Bacillus capparidis]MED1094437.1 dihydrolipoamide acetyltransferase family protein [Bacillus capparidis]